MNYQTRITQPDSTLPPPAEPEPQPPATCAATTRDGAPCRGRALPGTPFCSFHDPDRAATVAEGRSKGGAAPRRVRRVPLVLDHLHVAALMSELLVEAVNHPEAVDPKRLHAVTNLSRALMKAVGVPQKSYYLHFDRRETPAEFPHLRRLVPTPDPVPADRLEPEPQPASADSAAVVQLLKLPEEELMGSELDGLSTEHPDLSPTGRCYLLADSSLLDLDVLREAYAREQAAAAAAASPDPEPLDPSPHVSPAAPLDVAAAAGQSERQRSDLGPGQGEEQRLDSQSTGDPATEAPSWEDELRASPYCSADAEHLIAVIRRGCAQESGQPADPPPPSPVADDEGRRVLIQLQPYYGQWPRVGYNKD